MYVDTKMSLFLLSTNIFLKYKDVILFYIIHGLWVKNIILLFILLEAGIIHGN